MTLTERRVGAQHPLSADARYNLGVTLIAVGTPEKVVNLFSFIAEEVREILATIPQDHDAS